MNIWVATINWSRGEIDVSPKWRFAVSVWIAPSLFAELFVRLILNAYFIGIIAGIGVSLIKSYYDLFKLMSDYYPHLTKRRHKKLWQRLIPWHH